MKLLAGLLLLAIVPAAAQKKQTLPDPTLLPGTWRSVEDPKYRVVFTATMETEYYEKEVMSTLTYKLQHDSLIAKDTKSGEVFRYAVVNLNARTLSLLALPRGNTLKFTRQ